MKLIAFCFQCDRKFYFKKTLIRHLKIDHGKEYKKFKCPEQGCNVYFRLKMVTFMSLISFFLFVNQLELFEYFYQQSFYCLQFQGKLMRRHLTEVHQHEFNTVDGEFACEKCDKKCRTFEMLSKHIKVRFKFKCFRTKLLINSRFVIRQFMSLFMFPATSVPNYSNREPLWSTI